MNNYDDLQRFKEKTQTLDIAFKDMSGQAQETSHSQWALIRQLENGEQHEAPLGGGERIDRPQPQPLRAGELSAPAQAATTAQPRMSLLDSIAPNLKPTAVAVPAAAPPAAAVTAAPEAVAQPFLQTPPLKAAVREEAPAEPARFGALFRTRGSEPVSMSKETLLKPLLEKIALCR
ncbi:cellulose biosynthesis protein BcsO [Pantoea osteomyelitidis]|uniref:Cellulose biosynthesis protein BcsO n=1 Tax=Pantoea osteomyelitidis TaxID=3230026 RepID=A0ABW7PQZ6_9GAMM